MGLFPNADVEVIYHSRIRRKSPTKQVQDVLYKAYELVNDGISCK